jgi:hypothetical protein
VITGSGVILALNRSLFFDCMGSSGVGTGVGSTSKISKPGCILRIAACSLSGTFNFKPHCWSLSSSRFLYPEDYISCRRGEFDWRFCIYSETEANLQLYLLPEIFKTRYTANKGSSEGSRSLTETLLGCCRNFQQIL